MKEDMQLVFVETPHESLLFHPHTRLAYTWGGAREAGSKAKVNYSCGLLLILPPGRKRVSVVENSPLTEVLFHVLRFLSTELLSTNKGRWELGLANKDTLFLT